MRGWWARQRAMLADPGVRLVIQIMFWTWLATTAFLIGAFSPERHLFYM